MDVYDEIKVERGAQDRQWGGAAHDDEYTIDWMRLGWAAQILDEDHWLASTEPHPEELEDMLAFRRRMVRVAALAIAAIQALDRRHKSGSQPQ